MKNDAQLALEAAESMAKRLEEDVAIMMDLSSVAAELAPICYGGS